MAVGTVRKIAAALSLPVSVLLEPDLAYSPVEDTTPDDIATLSPGEFFADMPAIDARRG